MRFNFTGLIKANSEDAEKFPVVKKGTTKSGAVYHTLNLSVVADSNRAFLELFGMVKDSIATMDVDNKKISVDWDDRKDKDVVKNVANYKKFVYANGDDRHEFITEYDFVNYVADHIDDIKDKKFTVTGDVTKNFYKGKVTDRFQIRNIYSASDDRKMELNVNTVFYITKDSVDTSDWKEEKKIIFNGWTKEWLSPNDTGKDKGDNFYVPMTVIFDCSRLKLDTEKHVKILQYRLAQLGLAYKDGKIVNNIKTKKVLSNAVILRYMNGAEKKEFDESQLTDTQKEKIELGLATIDDFRPVGDIYGERITEYRLKDTSNMGDYADGAVYLDESVSEFEEDIFVFTEDEEVSADEFEGAMNEPEEKEESEDDEDYEDVEDLF